MQVLPYEVLDVIVGYFTNEGTGNLIFSEVCRRWEEVVESKITKPRYLLIDKVVINISLYKWAISHGMTRDESLIAAKIGSLEVLQYINGANPWTLVFSIADIAALHGHLHILKWLLVKISFSSHITEYAVRGNHIETLKWLRLQGYSSRFEFYEAVSKRNFSMMNWLVRNPFQGFVKSSWRYHRPAADGDLVMLQWLFDNGWKLDRIIRDFAVKHPDIIHWLDANGCPL